MLLEAELLVRAEDVLVEVLGRIRPEDEAVGLPRLHPGAGPASLGAAVERHLSSEARLLACLGAPPAQGGDVASVARAVVLAAGRVDDGDAPVPSADGTAVAVRPLLVRATLERALLAHYAAAYLGSTACPLTEELARPLWELTAPEALSWRQAGWFRAPLPLPDHVSWRDRFLLTAGHPPHPLGH